MSCLRCFKALGALLLVACANIGTPDGGRYDEEPPRVVRAVPADKAVGNKQRKIKISFNEFIKIENASDKVVISPPQLEMPEIRADGKKIVVNLQDTLQTGTTYTIDFSDAIVDNNEGNPMGHYTYSFSTGDAIDTMEVSGTVLNAQNLEPIKGIMVGLHNVADTLPPDSLLSVRAFERVSRTNGSGRFTIKGVKPATYRIFALQDMDGNYFFSQKSEMISLDTVTVTPYCAPDVRVDTVWHVSGGQMVFDSLRHVSYTHFYPDDIVLNAFLEKGQARYRLKEDRPDPLKFTLYFTAPADTLPKIRGLNFDETGTFVIEQNYTLDTLVYWVRDTTVAYQDTLAFEMTYMYTDSTGQLVPRTDTLELAPKVTRAKQLKELADNTKEWEKQQKKARRRAGAAYQAEKNPYLEHWIDAIFAPSSSIGPNENVTLEFAEPIDTIDSAGIHFEIKVDTLWREAPYIFRRVKDDCRRFRLYAEWRPKDEFRLTIDSAAVRTIYGVTNKKIEHKIPVRSLDDFGALFIVANAPDTGIVVQLLDKGDKVVRQQRADQRGHADFFYMKPGDYYVRCFIDTNGNNVWDTGDYATRRLPEEVFYFPQPLNVRAKWEVEQVWDVRGIRRTEQKPKAITKQKPDKDKQIKQRNAEREKRWGKKK